MVHKQQPIKIAAGFLVIKSPAGRGQHLVTPASEAQGIEVDLGVNLRGLRVTVTQDLADEVMLMDIYPAREKPIKGVGSELILEKERDKFDGASLINF